MYIVNVVVEGIGRGLLMHKLSAQIAAEMENPLKRSTRSNPGPEAEAEAVAYRLDPKDGQVKGQLMLPAEHFLGAIIKAGSTLQVKGRGKKTYKGQFTGQLEVSPDYIGLTNDNGDELFDFSIDSRPVRVKQARIIRHRPYLKAGWRAKFSIEVGDDTIPIEVIQNALNEAGKSCCVGDYRPRFGQFRVVSCDKTES